MIIAPSETSERTSSSLGAQKSRRIHFLFSSLVLLLLMLFPWTDGASNELAEETSNCTGGGIEISRKLDKNKTSEKGTKSSASKSRKKKTSKSAASATKSGVKSPKSATATAAAPSNDDAERCPAGADPGSVFTFADGCTCSLASFPGSFQDATGAVTEDGQDCIVNDFIASLGFSNFLSSPEGANADSIECIWTWGVSHDGVSDSISVQFGILALTDLTPAQLKSAVDSFLA